MTFSVQYSQPACWYVGAGDCGTMWTRRVLQSNYYTREYCCHDKGEEEGDGEGSLMTEGQFCSWRKEGFIHLPSEEKEGIIDESAAYNFQRRIKQAVKLHCTASSDGVGPSMRQKHSYIHVRRLSLDASLHVFPSSLSLVQLYSTHQGARLNVLSTPLRDRTHSCAREARVAFMPREVCLSAPRWICLASHEGDSAALKSFCVSVPYDSAALCSAHSCCALPSELSVTWRSWAHPPLYSRSQVLAII